MRKIIHFHFLGLFEHLCQEGTAVLYFAREFQYGLDSVRLKLVL